MSGLLLDTHVWLWSLLEPHRLGPKARARLSDPAESLFLSPVSVWEAHLLGERGRLTMHAPIGEWLRIALAASPTQEASLTTPIAIRSRELVFDHADPADRFLVATADVLGLRLVTADRVLVKAKGLSVLRADR